MFTPLLTRVVGLLLLTGALATHPLPADAQDRQAGGLGITVFADAGYRGTSATFRDDVTDLTAFGLNDRISSLRVAAGEVWEVCEHANFGGRCQVFSGPESELREIGWSDIISSARRLRGGGRRGGIPPAGTRGALQLYARPGFAGDQRMITDEVSDLRSLGFNDEAVSLRLSSQVPWEICVDAGFQNCIIVNSDWTDLRELNMRGRISSVRPFRQGGRGGRPPDASTDGSLLLFADRDYRGRSFGVTGPMTALPGFDNQAESVRINGGGAWELCDRAGFTGRCVTISSDVPNLGMLGLLNAVESARPAGARGR